MSASAVDWFTNESTATTVPAPATPRRASMLSGKSVRGSAPIRKSTSISPEAAARGSPLRRALVRSAVRPTAAAKVGDGLVLSVRPGRRPRRKAHVERAADIPAACGNEEAGMGDTSTDDRGRFGRCLGRLCDRRAAQHHHHRSRRQLGSQRIVAVEQVPQHRCGLAAAALLAPGCVAGQAGFGRRNSTRRVVPARAAPRNRRCSTGSSSRRSPHHQQCGVSAACVVDRRTWQADDKLRRQTVAQLSVDVIGSQHRACQLRPCVRVLVGAAGSAENGNRSGSGGGHSGGHSAKGTCPVGRLKAAQRLSIGEFGSARSRWRTGSQRSRHPDQGLRPSHSRTCPCRTASHGSPGRYRLPDSAPVHFASTGLQSGSRLRTSCRWTRFGPDPRAAP